MLNKIFSTPQAWINVAMGTDPLSPIAPARVRALLLPVGKVKRSRFSSFVDRLRPENVVRLGDVSPDRRPNRSMAINVTLFITSVTARWRCQELIPLLCSYVLTTRISYRHDRL